jgi:hypothetical protein
MSANVGDAMVLLCFNKGDMGIMFSWYKQTFGNIPQLISTIYKYDKNATFYHEFKNNPRFSVEGGQGKYNLMIADVELSDSGTYYCGSAFGNNVEFGQGVILIIKGKEKVIIMMIFFVNLNLLVYSVNMMHSLNKMQSSLNQF